MSFHHSEPVRQPASDQPRSPAQPRHRGQQPRAWRGALPSGIADYSLDSAGEPGRALKVTAGGWRLRTAAH